MKTISSVSCIAVLTLALASAGATVAFAQATPAPATTPAAPADNGGGRHHDSPLTADEKAQYDKAHDAAIAADPTLKTDEDKLQTARQALRGGTATDADKAALHQQMQDFQTKLHAAMLKIDPTLQPIFDKLAAAHKGGRGQ